MAAVNPRNSHLETLLRAKLSTVAADLDRGDQPPDDLTVLVVVGDWSLTVTATHFRALQSPAGGWDSPAPAPAAASASSLSSSPDGSPLSGLKLPEVQVNALAAALENGGPIAVTDLAHAAGYRFNSYWNQCIADLVRAGMLERSSRGQVAITSTGVAAVAARDNEGV